MFEAGVATLGPPVLWNVSIVLLMLASRTDIVLRIIPNRVSLAILAIGIVLRWLDGTLAAAAAAGAIVLIATLCAWRPGWMGGGDVKLLTACAFLVPPDRVFSLVLTTALIGFAMALVYFGVGRVLAGAPRPVRLPGERGRPPAGLLARVWRIEVWRMRGNGPLPYGCAIALATVLILIRR